MCKMTKFIYSNFNLTEEDKKLVPVIVAEIKAEIDAGVHENQYGENVISEYQLYDIFDEKLFALINN